MLISFTKQFFTFYVYRVKFENQILPSVRFEPTTACICSKLLTARPRGPYGGEQTTSKLIWKYIESIFLHRYILPFTLWVECEKLFCERLTKTFQINRKHYFVWNDNILLKIFCCIFNAYFKIFLHILVDFTA